MSARELGVDEHQVIKTLVMEDERKQPLLVLMHGDREVSTKNLARQTRPRRRSRRAARRSPSGTPATWSAAPRPSARASRCPCTWSGRSPELDRIYINGGRRGFLVGLAPAELIRVLSPTLVDAAIEKD